MTQYLNLMTRLALEAGSAILAVYDDTNFAIESIQQIIDGDLGTSTISTNSTVKISKTPDLLNGIYIPLFFIYIAD